jgi:hypothetical protein
MKLPALFRRREVWIPTVWGWLIVLTVGLLTLFGAACRLHSFLAPSHPVGAPLLVVEGWMSPEELDQAVDVFRAGSYERIVTTGGPMPRGFDRLGYGSYADLARDILVHRGLQDEKVIAVPAPASAQERTFLSGVMVREWARHEGIVVAALDVFSSGVHSRRSWLLYRMAFGSGVRVGILAARPSTYDPDAWWRTSVGAKTVLTETISWIWTELFFRPGTPSSHEEKWGVARRTPRSAGENRPEPSPGQAVMGR